MRANLIPLMLFVAPLLISPPTRAEGPDSPDLCAERVLDVTGEVFSDSVGQTISRFCKPRVDPPILDRDVCCVIGDSARCKLPNAEGRCTSGMKFWCEYGEIDGSTVDCFQDGPDACEQGHCSSPDEIDANTHLFADSSWICCNDAGDECVYVGEGGATPPPDALACYSGNITICSWGATNEDGTVDCLGT
ncbi:hypothetical protein ACNOYE_06865 [Nannocystaceae bacterium ST9]